MGSNFTGLVVKWYDESNGYSGSGTDITTDVLAIPLFTDTGSGEVNEAEIVLSAKGGAYITTGNKIDKFDRIRIQVSDIASSPNSYDRYFEVTDIIPSQSKTEGTLLTLICVGIEYHTQVIHYARRDWFENAFDIAQKIGDSYEANNGTRQPTISRHNSTYSTVNKYGNELPNWTNNHYEFGAQEDSCYNRWMDLITLLGGAVTNGGVGDFFDLGFDTSGVNDIDFALFVSGARGFDGNNPSNDTSAVTIENTTSINVSEQEGGILNPTGTKVAAWGSPIHGSLPIGYSKYAANELEFAFRPQWKTSTLYKVGAKIIDIATGKHYEVPVGEEHTSGTFSTDLSAGKWAIIDYSSEFGDDIQYSEWTDDKAALWANAGVDPDGTTAIPAWSSGVAYTIGDLVSNSGSQYVATKKHTSGVFNDDLTDEKLELVDSALKGNGASFFDANIVIRDDGVMFRTWVNEVVGDTDYDTISDASLSNEYLHLDGFIPANPPGHRILNVSNTFFTESIDNRGRSFENAILRYTNAKTVGDSGQWEVMYEQPTDKLNKMQVFDIKDRKIWEWDNASSKWTDKTNVTAGAGTPVEPTSKTYPVGTGARNDECAHEWKSIYNIQGSDPRPTQQNTTPFNEDSDDYDVNIRSAVEVCYQFTNMANDFISSTADTKKGAWINFGFPFPVSTYNGIGEGVGDIYGGGTNQDLTFRNTQPSLLDKENMSFTPTGLLGFNQTDSESLGPLSSLSFNMRVSIDDVNGNKLGGIAKMKCFMIDNHDNIVTQDFDIKFTDYIGTGRGFFTVNLPFSAFTGYRGREPKNWALRWGSTILGIEIPIQELDVQDVFNDHEIKYIGFQFDDFYDDEGRFDPQRNLQDMTNTGTFVAGGGTIRLAVDAFHFKKVLLAITGQPTVQNIEPQFLQRPNIMSYTQLKNEVNSQLEIEQFRHKEFNYQTSGNNIFDIRFGDTHFLKNSELISDADYTESSLGAGDGTPGTIRLVAKRIEYHLTKPTQGPGGITRSIKGVKRFQL